MTVRLKITLLITAAGFLSSLIFSCIISLEIIEQPFEIIDADLRGAARQAVDVFIKSETLNAINQAPGSNTSPIVDDHRYWLKIYDHSTHALVYQSHLSTLIHLPEPLPGSSSTVRVVIPGQNIPAGQDRQEKVPFRIMGSRIDATDRTFLVYTGLPMEEIEEEIWEIFFGIVSGLLFSVLLLVATSYFFAGIILKPVRIINDQARNITEKHLHRRIPVNDTADEFNSLAQTLNQVFDRLENAFIRQKRLLADASHELKTPLTMMRLALDEKAPGRNTQTPDLHARDMERLTGQVLRMERLVKNILDLSSLDIQGALIQGPIDLVKLLTSLAADYRFLTDIHKIHLDVSLPEQLMVNADAEKLYRAFSNILDNAVKYNVTGGRIEVIGQQTGAGLTIGIGNTGQGVARENIDKVFEEFFRVEKSRSLEHGGSGLGLAIAKKIIEIHAGSITFESRPGSWTQVTVCLPGQFS